MSSNCPVGLPQEAVWLKRSGMRLMLSLPCIHSDAVQGVVTIGVKALSLDHL